MKSLSQLLLTHRMAISWGSTHRSKETLQASLINVDTEKHTGPTEARLPLPLSPWGLISLCPNKFAKRGVWLGDS